jgi:hypothetical protein
MCMGAVTLVAYTQLLNPPDAGGTCGPALFTTVPDAGAGQGQICGGQSQFGAGCSGAQVCALVPDSFQACVARSGQRACPGGYGNTHAVGAVNDTRACSVCTCNGTPQCAAEWNFYNSPGCSGNPQISLHPDGGCQTTGSAGMVFQSNSLVTDAGAPTCGAPSAPATPTGALTLDNQQTVCCP